MITVEAIYIAPVKSLALASPDRVHVGIQGILEDRRFYLIDHQGGLLTQRQVGRLVQVKAEYLPDSEWLGLRFPDGDKLEGPVETGEPVITQMWGRQVPGQVVTGNWSQALTQFSRQPVQLVRTVEPGLCYDEYPVSMLSQASVHRLSQQANAGAVLEERRFRPNFFLAGCQPHEEDSWIGGTMRIGEELALQVVARDPRCAITTHDPQSGDPDIDTLGLILSYRPSPRAPYFGVYGVVERPGAVNLGDTVVPGS